MSRMTIGQAFAWLAEADPEKLAVRDNRTQLSRLDLELRSNQLARIFQRSGVSQDDLVAVSLPNGIDFILTCVAVWKLGATPLALSPTMPAEELKPLLQTCHPRVIVSESPLVELEVPIISPNVSLRDVDDRNLPEAAATAWKALTTSGSTGRPKIVMSTAGSWIDPTMSVARFIPKEATQLVAAPLYHSAPFTYALRGLMTGHSLIIHPRFDERRLLAEVSNSRVSWIMLVPTMMKRIMRLPEALRQSTDVSTIESILHIGAPCDPQLKRQWIDWLGPERIMEVYAGTESQGLTAISGIESLERPGSVGRPIGGTTLKIVDKDDNVLPPLATGEVLMTREGGPTYEYLGATSRRRGDWDSLGDLGYLDNDGYLYVHDRIDDLIIRGGVNVYPSEIERVLERHPHVRSAIVFGVPDADLGQSIMGMVDIDQSDVTEDELRCWANSKLERFKRITRLTCVRSPLRNDAGKASRRNLSQEFQRVNGSTNP